MIPPIMHQSPERGEMHHNDRYRPFIPRMPESNGIAQILSNLDEMRECPECAEPLDCGSFAPFTRIDLECDNCGFYAQIPLLAQFN